MSNLPEKIPPQLALEITSVCNYKCPYCYCLWHEYPCLADKVLSLEAWQSIIKEAAEKGCKKFLFTGGEVLLNRDLPRLIEYALSFPEVKTEIFTNGSRMTEELLQFFKSHQVKISTSLQGLRTYGAMTGTKRKFYKTIELIARCREIGHPCSVSVTVTGVNLFEVEEIVSAAAFAGAETIQLSVFMESGRGKGKADLRITPQQWLQVKERIKSLPCGPLVVFCDEFECRCMRDSSFQCPSWKVFGTVSPNGTYRKCLHYYQWKDNS